MGRGCAWAPEDLAILGAFVAEGIPAQRIAELRGWSVHSVWKAIRKLKKGEEFNRYKGRKSKVPRAFIACGWSLCICFRASPVAGRAVSSGRSLYFVSCPLLHR